MRPNYGEQGTRLNRHTRVLLVGLSLALVCVPPSVASAADDDATLSMARERFKEGVQYFDQELYDKARAAFVQAYALRKHPAVLLNLAQSEVRSGHEADAAAHFAQYLREHKDATEAERQGALAGLATAKAAVMEVPVQVDTDAAEIFVNQTLVGTSPLPQPLYLTPGKHAISARKDGLEDSVNVDATAGYSVTITLRPRASKRPAAPSEQGTPDTVATPSPEEPAPESMVAASVDSPGFFGWAANSPVAWIGGGLTLAGIAGGIGFGLASADSYDSADSVLGRIRQEAARDGLPTTQGLCTDPALALTRATSLQGTPAQRAADYETACARYSDNVDSGDSLKTLSTVSWVVAGVSAAGTIVYYFIDTSGSSESAGRTRTRTATRLRFVPYVSAGERGFAVFGEF